MTHLASGKSRLTLIYTIRMHTDTSSNDTPANEFKCNATSMTHTIHTHILHLFTNFFRNILFYKHVNEFKFNMSY